MKYESFVDGITKILEKNKHIKPGEGVALRKAFEESPKSNFDEFLIDEGLVDKDDLLVALSEFYQVPSFDAIGYFFEHALVRTFPKEFLISNECIPIELDENMMIVVASNPDDQNLLPLIGEYVSYDVRFLVGIRQDIIDAIQEYYDDSPSEPEFDDIYDENIDNERQMRIKQSKQEDELISEEDEFIK